MESYHFSLLQEDQQRLADHLASLTKLRGKLLGLLVVEHCTATDNAKEGPGCAFRQSAAEAQPAGEAHAPAERPSSAAPVADSGAGPIGSKPAAAAPSQQQEQQTAPTAPKILPEVDAPQPRRAQLGADRSGELATSRQQQSRRETTPDRRRATAERLPADATGGNGHGSGSAGGSGGIQVKAEPGHRPTGWSERRRQDGSCPPRPEEAGRQPAVKPEVDGRRGGEQMAGDQCVSSRPRRQHRQLSATQDSPSGRHQASSAGAQPAAMPDFISLAPSEGGADDRHTGGTAATTVLPSAATAAPLPPAGGPLMDFPPSPPPPLPSEGYNAASAPPQPPGSPAHAQHEHVDLPPHLRQLPPCQQQQQQQQQALQLPPHLMQQQAPQQQVRQRQTSLLPPHMGRQQQQTAPQQHPVAPPAPLPQPILRPLQLAAAAEPSSNSDMQRSASDAGEWQGSPNAPGHPGAARAWEPPDRDWSPPQALQPPQPDAFRRQLRDMPPLGSPPLGSQPLGLQRQPGSQPHPHEQHAASQPAAQRRFWQAPLKHPGGSGYTIWGGAGRYVPHDQSVVPVVFRNFAHVYEERVVQALQVLIFSSHSASCHISPS